MSSIHKTVAHRKTLTDIIELREQVVADLRAADEHRHAADQRIKEWMRTGLDGHSQPRSLLEQQIKTLDKRLWHHAFHLTGVDAIMDRQARHEMERDMEYGKVPPFTSDTVRDMFVSLAQDADVMFRRGVTELFRSLSGDYKRHEAFRVSPKIICRGFARPRFDGRGLEVNHYAADRINDLDRVMCAIQGRQYKPRALESAMNAGFLDAGEYQDDRIKARPHKNGTIHIHFLDSELLGGINRMIAEHYGETLPDSTS